MGEVIQAASNPPSELEELPCDIPGVKPEKVFKYSHACIPRSYAKIKRVRDRRQSWVSCLPPFRFPDEFTSEGEYASQPAVLSPGSPRDYTYKPIGEAPALGSRTPGSSRGGSGVLPPSVFALAGSRSDQGGHHSRGGYLRPTPIARETPSFPEPFFPTAAANPAIHDDPPVLPPALSVRRDATPEVKAPLRPSTVDALEVPLSVTGLMSIVHLKKLAQDMGDGHLTSVLTPVRGGHTPRTAINALAYTAYDLEKSFRRARERLRSAESELKVERARSKKLEDENLNLKDELSDMGISLDGI